MNIYNSIEDFPSEISTVVTIGTFDGIHKGHQKIINRMNRIVKKEGLQSVLLTFFPHPRHVLFPDDQKLKLIHTIEEKILALEKTNLQNLVIHEFTKDFSRINSVNFIRDFLVNKLNMKYMVVGYDHHFGKNREGTFKNLQQLSELYDFKLEKIKAQDINGVTVSSTKIRNAIREGDFKKVNSYLSFNFSVRGKVVKGNGLGRTIGFPTANIAIANHFKILPKDGVYAVRCLLNGTRYYGMLNFGERPTITDKKHVMEVHIFDFDKDIYYNEIIIQFVKRIRDEKQFDNFEQLKSQLLIDSNNCKKVLHIDR